MKTTITPFGKLVRQLRIECEVGMKDMADALRVSIAQLSAVETGKRKLTDGYVENVVQFFKERDLDETNRLYQAADQSREVVTFDLRNSDPDSRELVAAFARRFPTFTDKEKERFANLLNPE